ncbi:MAG: hypothetical protein ACJ757_13645 [Gaiellaceae bacterium]
MIPLSVFLYIEMIGAGLLASWFFTVCPRKGPKSLTSAIGPVIIAFAGAQFAPGVIATVIGLPYGMYLVLFGFLLPLFFSLFVTTGWLLRSLLAAVGGRGNGGGGHTVGA